MFEKFSVNVGVCGVVECLIVEVDVLEIVVCCDEVIGVIFVDVGIEVCGSMVVGLLIVEICMGGLGYVGLYVLGVEIGWLIWIEVCSLQLVMVCFVSQYVGWSFVVSKEEMGGKKFFLLGFGLVCVFVGKEVLFIELGYSDCVDCGVFVMEVDCFLLLVILNKLLYDCGFVFEGFIVILMLMISFVGMVQIVGCVLEMVLYKVYMLGFDLYCIVEGVVSVLLLVLSFDGGVVMGCMNDVIFYGGCVYLIVCGEDEVVQVLVFKFLLINLFDYGCFFVEIFKDVGYDFYKIDGGLFVLVEVWVSNLDSGCSWYVGWFDMVLLWWFWLVEF